MTLPRRRLLSAVLAGAAVALLASGAARQTAAGVASAAPAWHPTNHARSIDAAAGTALRADKLARAALTQRGGPITTSTGKVVTVFVSDLLPEETPEKWAEFIAGLTHGPEFGQLESHIVTLDEVRDFCGARALGCYGRDQMVALGETTADGLTPEEVVRHEYGHHVALHRLNTPWRAIDWGPKQWASTATVCSRVVRREAFPGDEGRNYSQNPGEAWAEVYRLMDERKAGITTATWQIIAPSFFPSEAALVAAEADVLRPWTKGTIQTFRRTFGKRSKKIWWIQLQTPLDGDIRVTAVMPNGGLHEVALFNATKSRVIRRAQWVGQRSKRLTTNVCGHRALFLKITQSGALGRVTISVTTP